MFPKRLLGPQERIGHRPSRIRLCEIVNFLSGKVVGGGVTDVENHAGDMLLQVDKFFVLALPDMLQIPIHCHRRQTILVLSCQVGLQQHHSEEHQNSLFHRSVSALLNSSRHLSMATASSYSLEFRMKSYSNLHHSIKRFAASSSRWVTLRTISTLYLASIARKSCACWCIALTFFFSLPSRESASYSVPMTPFTEIDGFRFTSSGPSGGSRAPFGIFNLKTSFSASSSFRTSCLNCSMVG